MNKSGTAASGSVRLLIVDDDPQVRKYFTILLQRAGYEVLQAESGDAAGKILDDLSWRIDLLMTDYMMPGMNGEELAQLFLQHRPEGKVMIVSGYADCQLCSKDFSKQEITFLQKPVSSDLLLQKVREVLKKKGRKGPVKKGGIAQ